MYAAGAKPGAFGAPPNASAPGGGGDASKPLFGAPAQQGAPPSFSFGAPPAASPAPTKPSGFSFGAASTTPAAQPPAALFGGAGQGAAQSAPAPAAAGSTGGGAFGGKPAGGFSFGAAPSSTAPSTAAQPGTASSATAPPTTAPGTAGAPASAPTGTPAPPAASAPLFGAKPSTGGFSFAPANAGSGASTGGLFGAKPGEGKQADTTTSETKPTDAKQADAKPAGFSFAPAAGAAAGASAPPSAGFSFGKPAASSTPAAPAGQASGGFSFGDPAAAKEGPGAGAPPLSSGGATTAPAGASAAPGSGLASPAASAKPSGLSFGAAAPAAPAGAKPPAAGGFAFGKPGTAPSTDDKAGGGDTTGAPGSAAAAPSGTAATATAAPRAPAPAPSLLRGKNMEEIVKMWQEELEASVKEFGRQAGEVAAWDRVLLRSGNDISKLVAQIGQAEERQSTVDQTLDYVEQQQAEMETMLDAYEAQRNEVLQTGGAQGAAAGARGLDVGVADLEREKAYALAENLNAQLDDMSRNLVSMIAEVNQLSAPASAPRSSAGEVSPSTLQALRIGSRETAAGNDDPIMQITAILNAHLGSLKWIDEHTTAVRDRLEALRRGHTEKTPAPDALRASVDGVPRSSTPSRFARDSSMPALGARARTVGL
ncbi:FG-nucleoporin nsp1 [Malassezia sp. CBS 17886]|nr:FG-nucleoporin nsp1 [Malassezia sp. CBS 17886]